MTADLPMTVPMTVPTTQAATHALHAAGRASQVSRIIPLCTGTHTYDKSLSTRGRGAGTVISAPILAYLIETTQGRVLYDAGCDHAKLADAQARQRWYGDGFPFGPPEMSPDQRLPLQLARLGIGAGDIDAVVLGHLHFDHAGGLCDFPGAEAHCDPDELAAAADNVDGAYFIDDVAGHGRWRLSRGDQELCPGLRLIATPGHTVGHRSLSIAPRDGRSIVLAGDAADLQENLDDEVAPGLLWQDREDLALASIRRLKAIAAADAAWLWPNHDAAHWRRLQESGHAR